MKKPILLVMLCISALAAPAQDVGVYEYAHPHRSHSLRVLYHKVTRYIASQQKLPWVRAVQRQVQKAHPDRLVGINWDFITPQPQPQPAPTQARVFQARMNAWQKQLNSHPVLHRFVFKTRRVSDVMDLSPAQQARLMNFLQNGTTVGSAVPHYAPTRTEEFKHYLVRLTLPAAAQENPIYLIVNGHTREVFLSLTPTVEGIPMEPLSKRVLLAR